MKTGATLPTGESSAFDSPGMDTGEPKAELARLDGRMGTDGADDGREGPVEDGD